jgi:hypothetical protein
MAATKSPLVQLARTPPRPPSELEIQELVRAQRQSGIALGVLALGGCLPMVFFFANGSGVLGILFLVLSQVALTSGYGQIWSAGGLGLARWKGAKASVWVVTEANVDTDSDGDAVWYCLRVVSCEGRRAALTDMAALRAASRGLDVRMCPRRTSSSCDWVGEYLIRVMATDGTEVVYIEGTTRLHRTTASPWDWLVGR